jgi:hypothetical protein
MNGRTCQLCGKALSRFSVGSGGDFCSREHRNQFRLRLGMDRLMEANKVASLMRRRENAKTIPASQLARDTKVLPRVAPLLRMPVHPPDTHPLRPIAAALESPAIVSRAGTPRPSLPAAATVESQVRSIEPHAFNARPKRLALPQSSSRFEPRLLPAGMVIPRLNGAALARLRREVTELRLILHRTHIGGTGIQLKALRLPTQNCQEPQPARRVNNTADRGVELRVSGGIGFRLGSPRIRSIDFGTTRIHLPSRSSGPRGLTQSARPKQSSTQTAGMVRFVVRGPASPLPPRHSNGVGFHIPEALLNGTEIPRQFRSDTRACDVKWIAPSPRPPQVRHTNGEARLRNIGPVVPLLGTPAPRGIPVKRRASEVAFQPQETMFECPTALHGTLLSSVPFGAAAPVRKVEPPPVALEEHFDGGLHNWAGGTGNWKVDVAGVRPGDLAFYSPSMELPHYLLEFLTRIELRGMTWVFRAANDKDYYKATLAMAQGGGFEFRRSTVIGGLEEGATVRNVPPPSPAPTGKTAVTVRTRVAGNEFSVSIDGQVIDTWTDARLTAGGIGFVGAPEERARLYWVKVTPIGHTSKEYSKR